MDEVAFWYNIAWKGKSKNECWEWQGQLDDGGYGRLGKAVDGSRKAHREAWKLRRGHVPTGINVLHWCDNRRCCNPRHLFLGTNSANSADMVHKGRQAKKEGHGRRKLGELEVTEVKNLDTQGFSQSEIARRFCISQAQVSRILRGENWK